MAKDEIKTQAKESTAAEIKSYLKAKGHKSADVEKEKYTTKDDKIKSICKLHGVNEAEYQAGKRKAA